MSLKKGDTPKKDTPNNDVEIGAKSLPLKTSNGLVRQKV